MQIRKWRWRGGGEAMVRERNYQWIGEAHNTAAASKEIRQITLRTMCTSLREEGILGYT